MSQAVPQAVSFRHVVFPDVVGGFGRAPQVVHPEPTLERGGARDFGPHPLSPEAESFLRWLFAEAGLDVRHYKTETLARRLPACLRAVRTPDVRRARDVIGRQPHLLPAAAGAMLIGVTSFFRDPAVFDALGHEALPELLGRRCRQWARAGGPVPRPLRVWSAGCSDGTELYSVAMLLEEWGALGPGRSELVGTDCRPDALARAAAGAFDLAAVRAVPPGLLARHFTESAGHFHASPALRAAATWRAGDVLARAEPGPWDVVLCRNVAIYLRAEAAAALWARLAAALRPGGLLVLGKAERPLGVRGLAPAGPCLYRRDPGGGPDA